MRRDASCSQTGWTSCHSRVRRADHVGLTWPLSLLFPPCAAPYWPPGLSAYGRVCLFAGIGRRVRITERIHVDTATVGVCRRLCSPADGRDRLFVYGTKSVGLKVRDSRLGRGPAA